MLLENRILYSLNDVTILPVATSGVRHRSDCDVFDENGMLPIFTAPMPCVINKDCVDVYKNAKINPIIPRSEKLDYRLSEVKKGECFVAFSLDEFTEYVNKPDMKDKSKNIKVLIDIANGNMDSLRIAIRKAKKNFGNNHITIMGGNIANPSSFLELSLAGCDYIRCSVGSGTGCNTTTYTGVYFPMATLINDCFLCKKKYKLKSKIVADGGLSEYRDCFKCFALGADYVMMGSTFSKLNDSAAELVLHDDEPRKLYYGMASLCGQKMLGKLGKNNKSAVEGKVVYLPVVNKTIQDYADDFSSYLKSCMSYCGCFDLEHFVGNVKVGVISNNAFQQYNK